MNVPNLLTVFRLVLIPCFVLMFFSGMENSLYYSILIFIIAGITDVLDGHIARKYDLVTDWGKILDPLADKLLLITVLACLVIKDLIPLFVLLIILSKEGFMIVIGSILYRKGTIIPSNIYGKATTVIFYFSILTFIFNEDVGLYLIYLAVVAAILSLVNYGIVYYRYHRGALKKDSIK